MPARSSNALARVACAILVAGATFAPAVATAQATAAATTRSAAAPLFETHDVLELTLKADLRTLFRDRDSTRRVQHEGTLTVVGTTGTPTAVPVRLRTRGHYRRQSSVCTTPPLRLRFRARDARNTPFEGQRDLKLVVQCRERPTEYEQYILKEYLVYRTFGLLTDRSFRARLLRVTWEDAGARTSLAPQYAFVIEAEPELAQRTGARLLEQRGARDADLDQEQTALVDLFQYLVGNTDWSIPGLHNIVLFMPTGAWQPFPVPYDFDWTGMVEARYASPDERLRIPNVRTRLYRGLCRSPEDLAPTIARFQEKRAEIETLWRTAPGLDDRTRNRSLDYIADFYRTLENRNALRRELTADCRRP